MGSRTLLALAAIAVLVETSTAATPRNNWRAFSVPVTAASQREDQNHSLSRSICSSFFSPRSARRLVHRSSGKTQGAPVSQISCLSLCRRFRSLHSSSPRLLLLPQFCSFPPTARTTTTLVRMIHEGTMTWPNQNS